MALDFPEEDNFIGTLLITPESTYCKFVKACNSEVNYPGHRFKDKSVGDIGSQAAHPST